MRFLLYLVAVGVSGVVQAASATPEEQCQIESYQKSEGRWSRDGNSIGSNGDLTPISWTSEISMKGPRMRMDGTNADGTEWTAFVDLTPGAFKLNDQPFSVVRCERIAKGGYLMEIRLRDGDQETQVIQLGYPDRLWYGHWGVRVYGSNGLFKPTQAFFETRVQ